jgi:hypothetical protein
MPMIANGDASPIHLIYTAANVGPALSLGKAFLIDQRLVLMN